MLRLGNLVAPSHSIVCSSERSPISRKKIYVHEMPDCEIEFAGSFDMKVPNGKYDLLSWLRKDIAFVFKPKNTKNLYLFVYCAVDPVLDIRLSWRNFPSSTIVFLDEDNIPVDFDKKVLCQFKRGCDESMYFFTMGDVLNGLYNVEGWISL